MPLRPESKGEQPCDHKALVEDAAKSPCSAQTAGQHLFCPERLSSVIISFARPAVSRWTFPEFSGSSRRVRQRQAVVRRIASISLRANRVARLLRLLRKPCLVRCAGWGFSFLRGTLLTAFILPMPEHIVRKSRRLAVMFTEEDLPGALRRVGFFFEREPACSPHSLFMD